MALLQLVKNPKNLKAVTLAVTASQDEVSQFILSYSCVDIFNFCGTSTVEDHASISGGGGLDPASCSLFLHMIGR